MSRKPIFPLVVMTSLCVPVSLQAVVQTIDATVTSSVEQTLPSGDVNTDFAYQDLGESTGNLPILAGARLMEGGYVNSGAGANSRMSDPRTATTSDPAELGIAVVSNSTNAPSTWSAVGTAVETRTITFTSGEIGAETGTALTARSFFFLDAVLVLWRQAGSTDLTGTAAEVSVRVDQTRGTEQASAVLVSTMSLIGQADGTGTLVAGGSLVPENAVEIDVTDLVPSMSSVRLVVLPKLAIPYEYPATVGETFTLKASIDGRITSGTDAGAAVILGVSLEEVVGFLSDVAGQDLGQTLGQVLGVVIKDNPVPARPLTTDDASTTVTIDPQARLLPGWPGILCGTLGVESAMAVMIFAGFVGLTSTRRLRG